MSAQVVKLGDAILGEWRAAAKRPAMPANERKVRQRRNSCSRLAHLRRTHCLALGEATAWVLVIANIVAGLGKPVTRQAIADMAISFGLPEIEQGILDAVAVDAETARRLWGAGRHVLLTPAMVGALLGVTSVERQETAIRDIDAVDETAGDRRRRLDRERRKAHRTARAAEAGPRLTQAQQAAAKGISLSTLQRQNRADLKNVGSSSKRKDVSARDTPARVRKRTPNRSAQGQRMRDPAPLQHLAASVWGALSADDAAMLHRLAHQVGRREVATLLGALAHRVATGSIDPPSAATWLGRQGPRHGGDP